MGVRQRRRDRASGKRKLPNESRAAFFARVGKKSNRKRQRPAEAPRPVPEASVEAPPVSGSSEALEALSVAELRRLGKERGLKGVWHMRKADLVKALS